MCLIVYCWLLSKNIALLSFSVIGPHIPISYTTIKTYHSMLALFDNNTSTCLDVLGLFDQQHSVTLELMVPNGPRNNTTLFIILSPSIIDCEDPLVVTYGINMETSFTLECRHYWLCSLTAKSSPCHYNCNCPIGCDYIYVSLQYPLWQQHTTIVNICEINLFLN